EEQFFNNSELIDRFEQMLEDREVLFFDAEEYCEIISYYFDVGDLSYAKKAIEYAAEMYPNNTEIEIKILDYFIVIENLQAASFFIKDLKDVAQNDMDYLICEASFWSKNYQPIRAIIL